MATSQIQDQDLYSPDHIFSQDDSPHLQRFDKDQHLLELAASFRDQNAILQVTTKEETFTGKVKTIHIVDETHLIEFTQCYSTQGEFLSHRQYFTFDIQHMQEFNNSNTQDSDASFEILAQRPPTPQYPPGSPSQDQSQQSEHVQQDSPHAPISPPQPQLQPHSQESYEDIGLDTSLEYDLPIQHNGTVDIDLLKVQWKTYYPQIQTFTLWCRKYNIQTTMSQQNLIFGPNETFVDLKRKIKSKALHYYSTWAATYHIHKLDFGSWTKDANIPKPFVNEDNTNPNFNIDLAAYHIEAMEIAQKASRQEHQHKHKLREVWASSLMATHSLPFPDWLEKVKMLNLATTIPDKNDLDTATWADIKPHDNLFYFAPHYWQKHKTDATGFILEGSSRGIYQGDTTQVHEEDLYPGHPLGHIYIPNYVYIPHGTLTHLKLYSAIHDLPHLQQLLWSRLKDAQQRAYESEGQLWSHYYTEQCNNMTSPFAVRFLSQLPFQTPFISNIHIVQHLQAHEYCKKKGGPKNLEANEFFDLFLRPLEFLCGQGMPLHTCMVESVHSFSNRANFIKILIEIAGFSIHDSVPEQMHMYYAEMSKIRHLQGRNLTPQWNSETEPYHRLESMPRVTNANKTKVMFNTVEPKDFAPDGRFYGFVPNHFTPLPDYILEQFTALGGKSMAFCDEHALHYHMLRTFRHWKTNQTKPIAAQTPSAPTASKAESKVIPEKKKPPSQPTPAPRQPSRPQIGSDTADKSKSWVEMLEETPPASESPTPAAPPQQIQLPPQPHGPIIQMSTAQLRELMYPQIFNIPKQATRPHVKSTPPVPSDLYGSPELIYTQSQATGRTMFEISKQSQARLKAHEKSSIMDLPTPQYHPSISLKPTWAKTGQVQPIEKIGDPEMIWSCTGHYTTPNWAKQPHSAKSLDALVDKTIPLTEHTKTRYRRMPKYHQFPADGLNCIKDVAIYMTTSKTNETVTIQVTTQPYKSLNSKTTYIGAPDKAHLTMPLIALGRFNILISDMAEHRLRPAMEDVQQEDYVLCEKHQEYLKMSVKLSIIISSGYNGLERMLHITLNPNVDEWKPEYIQIPWIRLAALSQTIKDLMEECRTSGHL